MITKTIDLLGRRGKDKVTGFEGIIASACFDLYGCVQVVLTPPKADDGKLPDGHWFDVARIELLPGEPVMRRPDFAALASEPEVYDRGPAEKPMRSTVAEQR